MKNNNIDKLIDFLLEKDFGKPKNKNLISTFRNKSYLPTKNIDEPEDGPLGKILFSPSRIDGVDTNEPNTDLENQILKLNVS